MKIPYSSLRTISLLILISLAHVASLVILNFYTPRPESKSANRNQLQPYLTDDAVVEINLNTDTGSSLPSVIQDSKTSKEVNLAHLREKSDENSSVFRPNPKITTQPVEIDKSLKGFSLAAEANDFVLKTENESALPGNNARAEKGFKNYFAENDGKKFPVYVYYGGYDMNSKPVGKGFLSYKFDSTDSKYNIELFAEAIGWAQIFLRRPIFFASEGYVSGITLKPTYYETVTPKRGKSYVKVSQASSLITFHKKTASETFFGNIYDPLSLIFQIASYSKNGQIFNKENLQTFQVFNRKKLEEIQLSPSPPEEMVLPNGDFITAVKVVSRIQRGGKKGNISFWLDTSYDNHPVRITFENKTKNYSLDFLIETGGNYDSNIEKTTRERQESNNKSSHPYFKY
ncbi:DUF3108 domain-containing protein [Betaproteobacteria bacterium]|nr:DUF3108 domain-containing protein [Betaproteobacteria bacterium]